MVERCGGVAWCRGLRADAAGHGAYYGCGRPGAEMARIRIQYRGLGNIAPVLGGILGSSAAVAAAGKCTRCQRGQNKNIKNTTPKTGRSQGPIKHKQTVGIHSRDLQLIKTASRPQTP